MKQCSKCLIELDLSKFYRRRSGVRSGEHYNHCKKCLRERGKQYYKKNRKRQLALANQRRRYYRKERKEFIVRIKDKPCVDCKKKYPHYVMDFDHRDGEEKKGNIAHLVNRSFLSYKGLLAEIEKCDLVCANCHRIRTFTRIKTPHQVKCPQMRV